MPEASATKFQIKSILARVEGAIAAEKEEAKHEAIRAAAREEIAWLIIRSNYRVFLNKTVLLGILFAAIVTAALILTGAIYLGFAQCKSIYKNWLRNQALDKSKSLVRENEIKSRELAKSMYYCFRSYKIYHEMMRFFIIAAQLEQHLKSNDDDFNST